MSKRKLYDSEEEEFDESTDKLPNDSEEENELINSLFDDGLEVAGLAKKSVIPSARPNTYLGKHQGDHVTPYGLIKSALTHYSKIFFEADLEVRKVEKKDNKSEEDQENLTEKQSIKNKARENMFNILRAVMVLNKESDLVNTSSVNNSSPTTKRAKNISGLEEEVQNALEKYDSEVKNYIKNIAILNDSNVLEEEFKKYTANAFAKSLTLEKIIFLNKLATSSLKFFNNIKGITYENENSFSAKEFLKKQNQAISNEGQIISEEGLYFHPIADEEGLYKKISTNFADAPFVINLLTLLKNLSKETKREDEVLYGKIANKENLAIAFSNSFFLPLCVQDINPSEEYGNSNIKVAKRRNTVGELHNHMARHLFLITACFPVLTEGNFNPNHGPGRERKSLEIQSKTWTSDDLMKSFISKQLKRHNLNFEDESVDYHFGRVKKIYDNFVSEASQKKDSLSAQATPNIAFTKEVELRRWEELNQVGQEVRKKEEFFLSFSCDASDDEPDIQEVPSSHVTAVQAASSSSPSQGAER
jgi:hypothetical protein